MRIRIIPVLIAVCVVLPLRSLADAPAMPMASQVPDDALVYFGWRGADALQQAYDGSHLKAVLSASNLADVASQLFDQAKQHINDPQGTQQVELAQQAMALAWKHPMAFYVREVSGPGASQPDVRATLICDAGADSPQLASYVQKLVANGNNPSVVMGTKENLVWITAAGEQPDTIASPLQDSADFVKAASHLQTDAALAIYVSTRGILSRADSWAARDADAQRIWPAVRDALGLTNVTAFAVSGGFDGADWMTSVCLMAPAPRTGLLAAIEPSSADAALLARVPATAQSVSFSHFDLAKLFDVITAAFASDPDASNLFHKGVAAADVFLGRNLRQQILGPLGPQWMTYSTGPGNFVMLNKPTDVDVAGNGLVSAMYGISNGINLRLGQAGPAGKPMVTVDQQTISGTTVTTATIGAFAPSIATGGGFLYFSMTAASAVEAVNLPDVADTDITHRAGFAAALARLNAPSIGNFEYDNLPETASAIYPELNPGIDALRALASSAQITIPPVTLPPLDVLTSNLSPSLSVMWADSDGVYSRSISPFPISTALAGPSSKMTTMGATALMTAIMLPALNHARETAKRVQCASNERQIGQGILLYANDHRGKYPPDLGTLIKTEPVTAEVFICPSGDTKIPADVKTPDQLANWVNDHGDYVYVGKNLTMQAGPNDVVVYEKGDPHHDGMNILFGDGHVEFVPTGRARQLIQQQQNKAGNNGDEGI